jgi:hypothetical protein
MFFPHTLVEFGGTLQYQGAADEIWACGVRGISLANVPTPDPAALMASLVTPMAEWYADAATQTSNATALTWLKVNNIGADGKYIDNNTNVHDYSPVVPGAGGQSLPGFCCVALSWMTVKVRGRGAKGRIFLPALNATMQGGSHLTTVSQQSLLDAGVALILQLSNPGQLDDQQSFLPGVFSRIDGSHNPITGVRVGNVIDYQSRRKNASAETYLVQQPLE